jgi:hypothetical protein
MFNYANGKEIIYKKFVLVIFSFNFINYLSIDFNELIKTKIILNDEFSNFAKTTVAVY